ncbi:MAG TPA: phosphatase PAP2 family protein [Candidatus Sulfomarinibacteraceae bacterium]|nr:phosphatase PAP2 family protein [Candidatus Sulfomarinibacteraceae bacterium]
MTDELELAASPTVAIGTAAGPAGMTGQSGPAVPAGIVGSPDADLHRRNDRLLLATIAGYVVLLSGLMIVSGVSVTPDVMLVALGLAAVILGRGRLFIRDWVPFIGLFLAYELMRGYADDINRVIHDADVLGLERALFGGLLPTQVLQETLHPATGMDPWAIAGTIFYFLHFPLPIAVAFLLWVRRRRAYYDYVAALILLSMAGFVTYLFLPVAPPWWAATHGLIPGPDGAPAIVYLKAQGFDDLARLFGFEGRYLYSYTIYEVNPNAVAAFPSLHAAYPFLAFLFARRAFGRIGWAMILYAVGVWFSIVYLADHYVVDILGGVAYAIVAYLAIVHAPGWFRQVVDRAADPAVEADVQSGEAGDAGAFHRAAGRVRWAIVRQGLLVAAVGAIGVVGVVKGGWLGGEETPVLLLPWALIIAGLWRAALGAISR